jgi:hypothetical protein
MVGKGNDIASIRPAAACRLSSFAQRALCSAS